MNNWIMGKLGFQNLQFPRSCPGLPVATTYSDSTPEYTSQLWGMVREFSEKFPENFNEASDFPDHNKAQQVSQVRLVSGQIFVRGVTNSQTA